MADEPSGDDAWNRRLTIRDPRLDIRAVTGSRPTLVDRGLQADVGSKQSRELKQSRMVVGGRRREEDDSRAGDRRRSKPRATSGAGQIDFRRWNTVVVPMEAPIAFSAPRSRFGGQMGDVNWSFIHDPNQSSLDRLPNGARYRAFRWTMNDFPGDPEGSPRRGPNEGLAKQMNDEFASVWRERRVTLPGGVVTKRDVTDDQIRQIQDAAILVPGQGNNRLQPEAAASFAIMAEAARADGVSLRIGGSGQPRQIADSRRRALSRSRTAVAAFSSHNMGLGVDLDLVPGVRETFSTVPMPLIVERMQTAAHKWMLVHGPEYGWYPYRAEPWHFEFNPPGYRERFRAEFGLDR